MVIIRPTVSLAKRMKLKLTDLPDVSTTRLGDWYGLDIVLSRKQFVLCTSSLSRLAVVLDAAPYATFPERLPDAVLEVLRAINVSDPEALDEAVRMREFKIGKTADRSVIGTMNEYRYQLQVLNQLGRLNMNDPLEMSLRLSEVISS